MGSYQSILCREATDLTFVLKGYSGSCTGNWEDVRREARKSLESATMIPGGLMVAWTRVRTVLE